MTQNFENWTAYDDWLIKNYNDYEIYNLNENDDHTITAEYREKKSDNEKGEGK